MVAVWGEHRSRRDRVLRHGAGHASRSTVAPLLSAGLACGVSSSTVHRPGDLPDPTRDDGGGPLPGTGEPLPDPDHAALVAAAIRGDRGAADALLADVLPTVSRYCRGRLGHLADSTRTVDDVVQEVCIAVFTSLPRYRPVSGSPFIAFVLGIAHNKIVDAYRAAARHRSLPSDELPEHGDPAPGPEQLAERAETLTELRALIARLPARHQDILVMRLVNGLSTEEVAGVLDMSPGAVRVAQHRALQVLRRATGPSSFR